MLGHELHLKLRRFFHSKTWAVLLSILILVGLQWLEFRGWLPLVNGRILDVILRHRASQSDSDAAKEIYTIGIDDDAYRMIFDSKSPMYPERVLNLVKMVADANPKVLGVDIRTEDPVYNNAIDSLTQFPSFIVWISSFTTVSSYVAPFHTWLVGAQDRTTVYPGEVLGNSPFELRKLRQTNWGIPLFARDEDKSIRRFSRFVSVLPDQVQGGGYAPSWARRVADLYCFPECESERADEVYISYAGVRPQSYCVSDLFRDAKQEPKGCQETRETWSELKPKLFGKIVLLGGTFQESSDFYQTPERVLPGLVVNAYAVKAELGGSGLEPVSQPLAWMLDLLLALLIIWVCDEKVLSRLDPYPFPCLHGWKRKKVVFATLIVAAFCVGSFFVAHGRYLLGFAGEGLGVLIDRIRDAWEFSEEEKDERELKPETEAV